MEDKKVDDYIRMEGEKLIKSLQRQPNKSIEMMASIFSNINKLVPKMTTAMESDYLVERFNTAKANLLFYDQVSILSHFPRLVDTMDFGIKEEIPRARETVVQGLLKDLANGTFIDRHENPEVVVQKIEQSILTGLDVVVNHFKIDFQPQTTEKLFNDRDLPEPKVSHTEKFQMLSEPSPECVLLKSGQKLSRLELIKRVIYHNWLNKVIFPRFGLCRLHLKRNDNAKIIKHCNRYNEMSAPVFMDMSDFIVIGSAKDMVGIEREVIETFQEIGTCINDHHDSNSRIDPDEEEFLGLYSVNRQEKLSLLEILCRKLSIYKPLAISRAARYTLLLNGQNTGHICHRSGGFLMNENVLVPKDHYVHGIGEISHKQHLSVQEILKLVRNYKELCKVENLELEFGEIEKISHYLWKIAMNCSYPGIYIASNGITSCMFFQSQKTPLQFSFDYPIVQTERRNPIKLDGSNNAFCIESSNYKDMLKTIFHSTNFINSL